jgi:shikimate kinase
MNNIYIVGFMGTGKSATGKELARLMGRDFLDLDSEIERRQGKTVKEIFEQEGEEVFRRMETLALQIASARNKVVIACGGGVVTTVENVPVMKKTGKVVCLTASLKEIEARTADSACRPLLNTTDPGRTILELFGKRLPLYKAAADLSIDTTGKSPEDAAKLALTLLGKV